MPLSAAIIALLEWMLSAGHASADYGLINSTVDTVGNALPFLAPSGICTGFEACGFVDIAMGIVERLRPLLTGVGALVICIAGYRMIVAQEDDAVTKMRTMMTATITGLVMVWLIEPFVLAFYGSSGEVPRGAMEEGATVVIGEVNGLVNWAVTIAAVLAVLFIILVSLKAIARGASEEGVSSIRKTIFAVLAGILLLLFRFLLSDTFVASTGNPLAVIVPMLVVVSFIMGFIALIGVCIVVYAGFLYVLSLGKEEQATKAKDLLIRAGIGVIVILVSLALVNFIILPGLQ